MDSILSVQNKDFTRDGQEFAKVPRAVIQAKKLFIQTNHWSLENLVKIYHGIIELRRLIDPEWDRWERGSTSERRHFSSIAAVKTAWMVVVRFHGMPLLSAKHSRWFVWWEKTAWKTIWRTIWRTKKSFWSNGWMSPNFSTRSIKTSSIWQESLTWDLSWVWVDRCVESRKEIFRIWKMWKHWTHQKFIWSGLHARKTCWWLLKCRFDQSESWKGFTKFTLREKILPKDICGPGEDWPKFKRLPDKIMCGQKYGPKLVKPLRIEKNKNGKSKSQHSIMLDDWVESTLLILMTKITKTFSNTRGENGKDLWHLPWPCKRAPNNITKVFAKSSIASEKATKTIYGCKVESHESTRQRVDLKIMKIALQGFTSMTHYNLVHKFIPMHPAMNIRDAKAAVDKEWKKARDNPSVAIEQGEEQKGGHSGSGKRQKESPLCYIDGHLPPQEWRSWNHNCRSTKKGSCSGETLQKTTLELM